MPTTNPLRHEQERPQPGLDVLEGEVAAGLRAGTRASAARNASTSRPRQSMPNGAWPISWKVSSASALMSIVSAETPRCSIRARALVRVRWVVPKPGIVRPWISRRSRPSMSQVVTATSSASVESRPPEMPMIQRRAGRELLDPLGQARALDAEDLGAAAVQLGPSAGTNGVPGTSRFSPSMRLGQRRTERGGTASRATEASSKLVMTRRSVAQLGDVDIAGDRVRVAADRLAVADPGRLGQQPAVLGDQAMAAEDDVGGRFGRPAAGHRIRRRCVRPD